MRSRAAPAAPAAAQQNSGAVSSLQPIIELTESILANENVDEQILLDLRGKAAALGGGSANAPATRGPAQLEDAVTALATVLVDADDMNDPIPDSVRSIVDGHIVLESAPDQGASFTSCLPLT